MNQGIQYIYYARTWCVSSLIFLPTSKNRACAVGEVILEYI